MCMVCPSSRLSYQFYDLLEGYTPLHVAILSRHWETAKVIIAIAKAQYEAPADAMTADRCDNSSGKPLAGLSFRCSFYLSEEYDEEYDEDSDIPDESNRKAEIVDISHRFSTIRVPVPPSALFSAAPHLSKGALSHQTPLEAAIEADDAEATKEILALHELCNPPFPNLNNILHSDSPALLDLSIRKFGTGLAVSEEEEDDDPPGTEAIKKMPKTYLGLDVHGVKRKDLAKRSDPDAPQQADHIPLLWSAANKGATKIIDWLATPAPLEAYKAFMSSASEEDGIAKALKKSNDLETQLPELLGFLPNGIGETAVFAALFPRLEEERKLAVVKQLYKLSPHLKNTFTASRVKGSEVTPILFICTNNCGKKLFDFFLNQGANPMDVDHRGYVILISLRFH
jgi:hypothetical protein